MAEVTRGFPVGMRILAVDNNPTSLLERLLQYCNYAVTTETSADAAIQLITAAGSTESFDLVLINIQMPESAGFRLLGHVNQNTNMPVVAVVTLFISPKEEEEEMVAKAVRYGANGLLLRPFRMEEIATIWQHAISRHHLFEFFPRAEDGSRGNGGGLKTGWTPGGRKPKGSHTGQAANRRKTECSKAESKTKKTTRFKWSEELHARFLHAVENLNGPKNAVPKRILKLMNVEGLAKKHITSHLQTYRLSLKKKEDDYWRQLMKDFCESPPPHTFSGPEIDAAALELQGLLVSSPSCDGDTGRMPQNSEAGPIENMNSTDVDPVGQAAGGKELDTVSDHVKNPSA